MCALNALSDIAVFDSDVVAPHIEKIVHTLESVQFRTFFNTEIENEDEKVELYTATIQVIAYLAKGIFLVIFAYR